MKSLAFAAGLWCSVFPFVAATRNGGSLAFHSFVAHKIHVRSWSCSVLGKGVPTSMSRDGHNGGWHASVGNEFDEENTGKRDRSCFSSSRRSIILHIGCLIGSKGALADEQQTARNDLGTIDTRRPYAPLENLLPATRVRILIDQAVETANALVQLQKQENSATDRKRQEDALVSKLKGLLLDPQEFMTEEEALSAKRYLEVKTLDDWTRARQKETQEKFQIEVDPATRANEAFEQWGERRQFKRLRRQQLALEQSNSIRAAFNAYTNNLAFGESYTVTASKEERSRLIRTYDQLPDVTSVVRSDLDLRDLYRNQVLTFMDDAKAELEYQLKSGDAFDATELLVVLKEAQKSCWEWFHRIPPKDVEEALNVVKKTKE